MSRDEGCLIRLTQKLLSRPAIRSTAIQDQPFWSVILVQHHFPSWFRVALVDFCTSALVADFRIRSIHLDLQQGWH